jgi:hypothetical protein
MRRDPEEWLTVEEDVLQLVRQIHSVLPAGTAKFQTRRGEYLSLSLKPANPRSATVGVAVEAADEIVYFDFGEAHTTWELSYESRDPNNWDKSFLLTELRDMFIAVILGRCEEQHKFLRVTGRIATAEHTYALTTTPIFGGPRGTKKYEPYWPDAEHFAWQALSC